MSLWKKEYQEKKYAYIDGEHDTPYKKLGKKLKIKVPRARHKHHYVNFIGYWDDIILGRKVTNFYLQSYCDICGKIGEYQEDEYTKGKKFRHTWFFPSNLRMYEDVIWAEEVYPIYHINSFKEKFLDLDKIQN